MYKKHLVFVETNQNGSLALSVAEKMGYMVSFIYSPLYENLFLRSKTIDLNKLSFIETVDDSFDYVCLKKAIIKINSKKKVDCILSVVDQTILPIANVARDLNIPFTRLEAIELTKNKYKCRQFLKNHTVEVGNSFLIRNEEDIKHIKDNIAYPCIMKPNEGAGSYYSHIIDSYDELLTVYSNYSKEFYLKGIPKNKIASDELVVEEYFEGPLFSAEIGINEGTIIVFAVGERKRWAKNEVIELGTTIPSVYSQKDLTLLEEYAKKIVRVLNPIRGIFHIEMILTKDGPRLIEVNPRLMGGNGPLLLSYACDINIFKYLIHIHLQKKCPKKEFRSHNPITSRLFGAGGPGITKNDIDWSWLDHYKNRLVSFTCSVKPNQEVKEVTSNYGYLGSFQVKGTTAQNSIALADEILQKVELTLGVEITK